MFSLQRRRGTEDMDRASPARPGRDMQSRIAVLTADSITRNGVLPVLPAPVSHASGSLFRSTKTTTLRSRF
jgi:hypothetical protein